VSYGAGERLDSNKPDGGCLSTLIPMRPCHSAYKVGLLKVIGPGKTLVKYHIKAFDTVRVADARGPALQRSVCCRCHK